MRPAGFLRDEGGAVVIIAGAAVAAAVGLAAFTVDLSNAYSVKGRLQNAADAAALAAAQLLPQSKEEDWEDQARGLALRLVAKNVGRSDGVVATASDVVFGQYDVDSRRFAPGAKPFNAVRVTTRRTAADGNAVETYFGGIFGVDRIDVQAQAIAMKRPPSTCLYAMDESATAALEVAGTASLWAPNCAIQVNSAAADAAVARGNGTVDAHSIRVVGGASGDGFSPAPETGAPAKRDPLAELPEPPQEGGCLMTDFELRTSQPLEPGTYCGRASFSGNAHFELRPGTYYFKDADVQISSASFTGKDVLIFLDANSSIHISGNGTHELTAAETGPYAGIVLYQSRNAPNPVNKKSGNSRLMLSGAIYMPSSTFQVRGTGDVDAKPGQVKSDAGGGSQGQAQSQSQALGQALDQAVDQIRQGGSADADGQAEGGTEGGTEGGEGSADKGGGQGGEPKKPAFITEIEYVVAYRFDLSGNANMKVGRQADDAGGLHAALVY